MPAYNSDNTVGRAIRSVISQTYVNWELLVGNDGSTDSTANIIKEFSELDNRIRLVENSNNLGVSFTRNNLLNLTNADLVAFLDSDDEWYPEKLITQVNFISKRGINFVCSPYDYSKSNKSFKVVPRIKIKYKDLLKFNDIPLLTVMIEKSLIIHFDNIGHEDYDLWLKILSNIQFCYCTPGPSLAKYNVSSDSLSSNKIQAFRWYLFILKKNKLNKIEIIIYTLAYIKYQIVKRFKIKTNDIFFG
jgi:glycosyltransferase involved in cell wall biosynthesis